MTLDELKAIADERGVRYHPSIGVGALSAKLGLDQPKAAPLFHSEESVRKELAEYLKKDAFAIKFDNESNCIHMTYMDQRGKITRDECITLSAPMRVIVNKAMSVAKGPLKLRAMGADGTYKGYADNILT